MLLPPQRSTRGRRLAPEWSRYDAARGARASRIRQSREHQSRHGSVERRQGPLAQRTKVMGELNRCQNDIETKQGWAGGGACRDFVEPVAGEARRPGQRPEMDLQEGSGDLDEPLQQPGGDTVTRCGGPQGLPGLVCLPEEERVEAIDAVEPLGQGPPCGWIPYSADRHGGRAERVTARVAQRMRREPGHVSIRRQ